MAGGRAVVVIEVTREPTMSPAVDLQRLDYRPHIVGWPATSPRPAGHRPVAVIVDFGALEVDAAGACKAARQDRSPRRAPVIALVPEQEGARIDFSLGFDELILAPYQLSELGARLRLLRWRMIFP